MGYSHYWHKPKELDAEKFREFASDVKNLIELAEKKGIVIKGGNGMGLPEISDESVRFNGDREKDNDGETFHVERIEQKELSNIDEEMIKEKGTKELYFKSCKTMLRPYDLVVVAALTCLKYRCPEVTVSSKSFQNEGIVFAEKVLGVSYDKLAEMLLKDMKKD